MTTARVVIEKERPLHTYAELWHASTCVLDSGIQNKEGSAWQFLSSLILTAFTFEAYLNHIGPQTIEGWQEFDRLPPWSKFELLSKQLNVQFSSGRGMRPLQTIEKLLNFRNTLAHGRSQNINPNPVIIGAKSNVGLHMDEHPLADWEKLIRTSDFALQAREDIEKVIRTLHNARATNETLFNSGISSHSATLIA